MTAVTRRLKALEQTFGGKASSETGTQIVRQALARTDTSDLKLLVVVLADSARGEALLYTTGIRCFQELQRAARRRMPARRI